MPEAPTKLQRWLDVVAYLEYALATGLLAAEQLAEDRPVVEGYNRDDCISTRALRDWLEGLRAEVEAREGRTIPRPAPPEPKEEDPEIAGEVAELMRALLEDVSAETQAHTPEQHVRWLAAHLLEWHRREDKSAWWDFFRLRDLAVDELIEETKALAGLEYVGVVGTEVKSSIHRYRFPQQDHRLSEGKKATDARTEKKPPGTEVFVLEHLAGEEGILRPDQGLFLGETWRMRPEITAFTSELFYESQLESRADLALQRLTLPDGSTLQGLVLEEVAHEGNARESEEEAARVVEVFRRLLAGGATFTDRKGDTRPLALDDILVVAPYNAQVERIRKALAEAGHDDARVGTVDKFQGQEAAVAIYSLASSSAEDAPRGMEFLYALDRLNVAMSRARVCTVVVASPALLVADCKRPRHMRMVNAVVRYGEMAGRGDDIDNR